MNPLQPDPFLGSAITYLTGALWLAILPLACGTIVFATVEVYRGPPPAAALRAKAADFAAAKPVLLCLAGAVAFVHRLNTRSRPSG